MNIYVLLLLSSFTEFEDGLSNSSYCPSVGSIPNKQIFVKFNTKKIFAGNIQSLPQSDKSRRYFTWNISAFVIILVTSLPYLP